MKKVLLYTGMFMFAFIIASPSQAAEPPFAQDLYYGIKNSPAVRTLQEFLSRQGVYAGPVTGNFLSQTEQGVKNFQAAHGISPVSGFFGPLTRAAANAIGSAPSAVSSAASETAIAIQAQINGLLARIRTLQQKLFAALDSTSSSASSTALQATPAARTGGIPAATSATSSAMQGLSGVYAAALGTDDSCGSYSMGMPIANRSRTAVDYAACLHIAPDPRGAELRVTNLRLTFMGQAVAGSFPVRLIDPTTGTDYDGSTPQTCTASSGSCTVDFSFSGTPIPPGYSRSIVLRIDSSGFANAPGEMDGMDITLQSPTDLTFYDTADLSGTGFHLSPDIALPRVLAHVDY